MSQRGRTFAVHLAFVVYCLISATAMACGFEDPSSLASQRGILNIVYPKSLYVSNAIWHAQAEGLLERDVSLKPTKALVGFNRVSTQLRTIGLALDQTAPQQILPEYSIVLLETMLWANYTPTPSGTVVTVHGKGPRGDDVVIVTDYPVVKAIVKGSLSADTAHDLGLLRYYGDADKILVLRVALSQLHHSPIGRWATSAQTDIVPPAGHFPRQR